MGILFIVATPIGNLEDITLRALRILREVSLIAAEDTRKTKILLNKYDIKTPQTSYFEHNKISKLDYILSRLAEGDVALVSEAGTPGLNDPGYELIKAAIAAGVPVVPVPGASIVPTALVVSGLPADRFTFLGYLPHKVGERRRFLTEVVGEKATLVVLETPHRLIAALTDILNILGDRHLAVCREITKIHEEVFRGTVSQALAHFKEPRGELALIIEGNRIQEKPGITDEVLVKLRQLKKSGATVKEAVNQLSNVSGISRRELYQAWLNLKE